ncbi:hypothetical protein GGI13_002167 [Coemansia sp. RSA 455]|nr:hypothetical protein GGI13_002167 [Coemansia sp. RSA 455]
MSFSPSPWFVSLLASVADQRKVNISRIAAQLHIVAGSTFNYYDCIVAPVHYDIIVGVPWMICNNANVNWDQRLLWTRFGAIPKFVPASHGEGREPEEPEIACIDVSPQDELWEHAEALYDLQVAIVVNSVEVQDYPVPSMPVHPLATKFAELYKDRLRDELPDELPPQHLRDPRLELRQEAELTYRAVYSMSAEETAGLHKVLDQLLARDQIYECDAAFASPAFVAKKKQDGYWLLVDMRQLNAAIKDFFLATPPHWQPFGP